LFRVYLTGLSGLKGSKTAKVEADWNTRSFEIRIQNLNGKHYK
jgi:hypothetical protein